MQRLKVKDDEDDDSAVDSDEDGLLLDGFLVSFATRLVPGVVVLSTILCNSLTFLNGRPIKSRSSILYWNFVLKTILNVISLFFFVLLKLMSF